MKSIIDKMKSSSPFQKISAMMLATIAARGLGMIREVVMGSTLGTSEMADAYVVAYSIPCTLVSALLTAISTTFVPGYAKEKNQYGNQSAMQFSNTVLNFIIILTTCISLVVAIFAEPIVTVAANGFNAGTLQLAIIMCRYMALTIVLQGITYVLIGYLHSNDEFTVPSLYTIPSNLIMITSLYLYYFMGMKALCWGVIFAYISQCIMLFIVCVKKGFRYKPEFYTKRDSVRQAITASVPVMITMAFYEINTFIDKMLASGLPTGSVASLNYAAKLNECLHILFSTLLATWIFPQLSDMIALGNEKGLISKLEKGLRISIGISVPAILLCFVYAEEGVKLIFERGVFDSTATYTTANVFRFYCIATVFHAIREIIARAFYAESNTKTPMCISISAISINVILNICLVKVWGLTGIAIASTVSATISAMIFIFLYKRKHAGFNGRVCFLQLAKSVAYMIPGMILSVAFWNYVKAYTQDNILVILLSLVICCIIAISIYILFICFEKKIVKKKM